MEQILEERWNLLRLTTDVVVGRLADHPKVVSEFVDDDNRLRPFECRPQSLGRGRVAVLVGLLRRLPDVVPEGSAHGPPQRPGVVTVDQQTIRRVERLADDRSEPDSLGDLRVVETVEEELRAGSCASCEVVEADESVGLTATKRGLGQDDRDLGPGDLLT